MKIMYISLREMMKFMPEANRLDGNIWVWIVLFPNTLQINSINITNISNCATVFL